MVNKMSSASKFEKRNARLDKKSSTAKFLKRNVIQNKINVIKNDVLKIKEDFWKLKRYRIEVCEYSYILFENEQEYLKIFKLENIIEDFIEDLIYGKCKEKKRIYSHLSLIKKYLKNFPMKKIKILYNPHKNRNPFGIKFPYICYFDDEEKEDDLLYELRKYEDETLNVKYDKLKDLISERLYLQYYKKFRIIDAFNIIEHFYSKSNILHILLLIHHYFYNCETDLYSEMEMAMDYRYNEEESEDEDKDEDKDEETDEETDEDGDEETDEDENEDGDEDEDEDGD